MTPPRESGRVSAVQGSRESGGYSLEAYTGLIRSAIAAGYEFQRFVTPPAPRSIYLRHDVDFSLTLALEIARANQALGVRGTFFVLLRSHAYNLLAPRSLESVRAMIALGQDVALHVSLLRVPTDDADLVAAVVRDFEILREHVPDATGAFAWHNTWPELIQRGLDLPVPGLVSAYGRQLFRSATYVSDSVMRRSAADLERAVRGGGAPALQLLLHPLYWVIGGGGAAETLARMWVPLVREQECEMSLNPDWAARMPNGIPEEALSGLVESILRSMAIHGRSRAPDGARD